MIYDFFHKDNSPKSTIKFSFASEEENNNNFPVFTPKIRLMMNLSRFLRVGMGIYYPIVDIDAGLNRRVFTEFCFEWGK